LEKWPGWQNLAVQRSSCPLPSSSCGHIPCCLRCLPCLPAPLPACLRRCLPACLQDGDEGIAVEACEFWTAFCESEIDKDVLRPFLPRVLPVLLKNMVRLCWWVGGWRVCGPVGQLLRLPLVPTIKALSSI
jgi:hypothetical protein